MATRARRFFQRSVQEGASCLLKTPTTTYQEVERRVWKPAPCLPSKVLSGAIPEVEMGSPMDLASQVSKPTAVACFALYYQGRASASRRAGRTG